MLPNSFHTPASDLSQSASSSNPHFLAPNPLFHSQANDPSQQLIASVQDPNFVLYSSENQHYPINSLPREVTDPAAGHLHHDAESQYSQLQANQVMSFNPPHSHINSESFQPERPETMPVLASPFAHTFPDPQSSEQHAHHSLGFSVPILGGFQHFPLEEGNDAPPLGALMGGPVSNIGMMSMQAASQGINVQGSTYQILPSQPAFPTNNPSGGTFSNRNSPLQTDPSSAIFNGLNSTFPSAHQPTHAAATANLATAVAPVLSDYNNKSTFLRPTIATFAPTLVSSKPSVPTKSASSALDSTGLLLSQMGSSCDPIQAPSQSSQRQAPFSSARARPKLNNLPGRALPIRQRITRACDQCNQLRTRCDGKNPCLHCVEHNLGCGYARERKKRGKVSKKTLAIKLSATVGTSAAPNVNTPESASKRTPNIFPASNINSTVKKTQPGSQSLVALPHTEASITPSISAETPRFNLPGAMRTGICKTEAVPTSCLNSRNPLAAPILPSQREPRVSSISSEASNCSTLSVSTAFSISSPQRTDCPKYESGSPPHPLLPTLDDIGKGSYPVQIHFDDLLEKQKPNATTIPFKFNNYLVSPEKPNPEIWRNSRGSYLEKSLSPRSDTHQEQNFSALAVSSSGSASRSSSETVILDGIGKQSFLKKPLGSRSGMQDVPYRYLIPIKDILLSQGISDNLACELLDAYFILQKGCCPTQRRFDLPLFPCTLVRPSQMVPSSRPRQYSPAFVASTLWVGAFLTPAQVLKERGKKEEIVFLLQDLTFNLLHQQLHRCCKLDGKERGYIESTLFWSATPFLPLRGKSTFPIVTAFASKLKSDEMQVDILMTYIHIATATSMCNKQIGLCWWNAAFQLARDLGVALQTKQAQLDVEPDSVDTLSLEVEQERRRVCWFLYILDRHLAVSYNRQVFFRPNEFSSIPKPVSEPDQLGGGLNANNSLDAFFFKHANHAPDMISLLIPFMNILGIIMDMRNCARQGSLGDWVQTNELLQPWKNQIRARIRNELGASSFKAMAGDSFLLSRPSLVRASYTDFLQAVSLLLLNAGTWDPMELASLPTHTKAGITFDVLACARALDSVLDRDPDFSLAPHWTGIYVLIVGFAVVATVEGVTGSGEDKEEPEVEVEASINQGGLGDGFTHNDDDATTGPMHQALCVVNLSKACGSLIRVLETDSIALVADADFLEAFADTLSTLDQHLNRLKQFAEASGLHQHTHLVPYASSTSASSAALFEPAGKPLAGQYYNQATEPEEPPPPAPCRCATELRLRRMNLMSRGKQQQQQPPLGPPRLQLSEQQTQNRRRTLSTYRWAGNGSGLDRRTRRRDETAVQQD